MSVGAAMRSDPPPEVVIVSRLFTPPDGKTYVLIEFIRFAGARNLNLRNSNFPSRQRPTC